MLRDILNLLKKDDLQSQALAECHEMLVMCEQMVAAGVQTLRNRDDASMDVDILTMDKKLNAFERDVRRKVMTHMTLSDSPDLSVGLKLVSIVIDLERIGDYSKNIVDLAVAHPGVLHAGPLEEQLAAVESNALDAFHRSVRAFKEDDTDTAREVMKEYKTDIAALCRDIEHEIVSGSVDLPAKDAATVALYLRFLKRISAHSRNLVSSLVNPFDRIGYGE